MNIDLVGKVQPLYVDTEGRLHYADCGVINDDWSEIIVTLKNGDSICLLRGDKFNKLNVTKLMLGVEYILGIRFSVGMCNRSGRNMSLLTASLEYVERV